jgi:hypothetical protein
MRTVDANLILGQPGTHPGGVATTGELLAEMDRQNIEKGLVTHIAGSVDNTDVGNRLLLGAMQATDHARQRLMPIPVADLERPGGGLDWDTWHKMGTRGARACPSFYGPSTHPHAAEALLDQLRAKGWFLQVPVRPFCGSRWQTGTVAGVISLAQAEADLVVMIVCPSRGDFAELCIALESCPNLWVDVGNLTTGTAVRDLVSRGYTDRLVCGSGFGVCYSTPSRDVVQYAPIPEAAREAILYRNVGQLLGTIGPG